MKFAITKTSNDDFLKFKEFNSIKELLDFQKKSKHPLIIKNYYVNSDGKCVEEPSIEIYDGYRE